LFFSHRIPDDLSHNLIFEAVEKWDPGKIWDLTQTNPTQCGFDYPSDLLAGLNQKASYFYEPSPFGDKRARQAVAAYLNSKGEAVDPENIVLTASTSEAYSYLFKLFGDPGDSFLVPTPGYPLLDHLGALEGVELIPYSLRLEPHWPLDAAQIMARINPTTRGFISINPHNPTGSSLSLEEQNKMTELCQKHGLISISDEVFRDYVYAKPSPPPWIPEAVLSFRLGGLSKTLGMPQLKLSWMVLDGPAEALERCKQRLELIADSYLSVNTPVQSILQDLLLFAPSIQKQILDRIHSNRAFLSRALAPHPKLKLWSSEGGWVALLEVLEGDKNDEKLVLDLFQKYQVLAHPGGFYDFPEDRRFLVLSLLPRPQTFQEGVLRLEKYFARS
jgi:alanine-synthesizing transaminase